MTTNQTFLIVLEPCRPSFVSDATDAESAVVARHFAYLQSALARGRLVLAGRADDGQPGLVVIRAETHEQALDFAQRDPAIAAGIFRATIKPFRLALLERGEPSTPMPGDAPQADPAPPRSTP